MLRLALACLLVSSFCLADIIVLKDGKEIEGQIVMESGGELIVKTFDGRLVTVKRDTIASVAKVKVSSSGRKRIQCRTCLDKGRMRCPKCNGGRKAGCSKCNNKRIRTCAHCNGTGHRGTRRNRCSYCGGIGHSKCISCIDRKEGKSGKQCLFCDSNGTIACDKCPKGMVDAVDRVLERVLPGQWKKSVRFRALAIELAYKNYAARSVLCPGDRRRAYDAIKGQHMAYRGGGGGTEEDLQPKKEAKKEREPGEISEEALSEFAKMNSEGRAAVKALRDKLKGGDGYKLYCNMEKADQDMIESSLLLRQLIDDLQFAQRRAREELLK